MSQLCDYSPLYRAVDSYLTKYSSDLVADLIALTLRINEWVELVNICLDCGQVYCVVIAVNELLCETNKDKSTINECTWDEAVMSNVIGYSSNITAYLV